MYTPGFNVALRTKYDGFLLLFQALAIKILKLY